MVLPLVLGGLAAIAPTAPTIGTSIIGAGLTSLLSPKPPIKTVPPGRILNLALQTQALSERGLVPVISIDPFTGDDVISTEDQSGILNTLLEERADRLFFAPFPEELADIQRVQQAFIQAGREGRIPPPAAPPVPETTIAAAVASPRATARLVAPGVVSRGNVVPMARESISSRLATPCAGPQTGISRLRCGAGGF